jgi:hypothetical protein
MRGLQTVLAALSLVLFCVTVGFYFLPQPSYVIEPTSGERLVEYRERPPGPDMREPFLYNRGYARYQGNRRGAEEMARSRLRTQRTAEQLQIVADYLDSKPAEEMDDTALRRRLEAMPPELRDTFVLELMQRRDPLCLACGAATGTGMFLGGGESSDSQTSARVPTPTEPMPDAALRINQIRQAREAAKAFALSARLAFELDTSMVLGKEYPAALLIQEQAADGATRQLDAVSEATTAPTRLMQSVEVQPEVRARISAADFTTVEDKGDWQLISPDSATIWSWRLKPNSTGTKSVIVFLEQKIEAAGETYIYPVANFPQSVEVEVTMTDWILASLNAFWAQFWPVIVGLGVLLGALLAAVQLWDRFRTKPAERTPPGTAERRAPDVAAAPAANAAGGGATPTPAMPPDGLKQV